MILLPGSTVMHDHNLLHSLSAELASLGISVVVHEIPDMFERKDIWIEDGQVRVRPGFVEERIK